MKVLVCGGRDYFDMEYVCGVLDGLHGIKTITLLIEGGANGADAMARGWAEGRGVTVHTERAIWYPEGRGHPYDRTAGPKRNSRMLLLEPDLVLAFPGGKGTADMTSKAVAHGLFTVVLPGQPASSEKVRAYNVRSTL